MKYDKILWGHPGGGFNHGKLTRIQSHCRISNEGFYFTFAIRCFGRYFRIRLRSNRPFAEFKHGLFTDYTIYYGYRRDDMPGVVAMWDKPLRGDALKNYTRVF